MRQTVASVKAVVLGFDEVMAAGDLDWWIEEKRLREGIPVPEGNWENLVKWAARLGVAAPG